MEIIEVTPKRSPQAERAQSAGFDLSTLSSVALNESHRAMLAMVEASVVGSSVFGIRMVHEARDVLALSEVAPDGRLHIDWMDLTEVELRVLMRMQVVVPRRPTPNNRLALGQFAMLGLIYPREAVQQALPGTAFFDVLAPLDLWHPSVSAVGPVPVPRLCLGPEMLPGIRCVDLIVMAYGALSMQSLQIDERDPAGVMNIPAARWWQQNTHLVPLTATPFLQADAVGDPPEGTPSEG